jgi:hypothetical protein
MPIITRGIYLTGSTIRHYRIMRTRRALCLALELLASFAAGAAPMGYGLTAVVRTGDIISGKTITGFKLPSLGPSAPAIDSGGRVAFYATYTERDGGGEGIFTQTSLVLKTGDVINGRTLEGIGFAPALNDAGTVAVRGFLDSQASAVLTATTLLTPNAPIRLLAGNGNTAGGQKIADVGFPAINNNGTVAFLASFSDGTGIFTQKALLAKSGDTIAGATMVHFGTPAINNRGTVAFQSWLSGPSATAILTPTSVLVKTGDMIGGQRLTDLLFSSALNSSDTVAFFGTFSGGTGIFTQRALLVRSGDTVAGQKLTSFGLPVIDDGGTVAFLGTYPGGVGIFTQSTVITKTGDTIDGRTLTALGQPAINCGGEVAFAAWFSDGSSAIMLARPVMFQSSRRATRE